jgi:hypothetical protein
MRGSVSTPWGQSDDAGETIAPGIVWYDTASHGGIHLSPERHAAVRKRFPGFTTFGGNGPWYEEDCDWAVVVFTFPEHFDRKTKYRAMKVAHISVEFGAKWKHVLEVLGNTWQLATT